MARFRTRTVEVDAIAWTGENEDDLSSFTQGRFNALDDEDRGNCDDPDATGQLLDSRHETWRLVYLGDWIVRDGRHTYICRPGPFAQQFEAAGE